MRKWVPSVRVVELLNSTSIRIRGYTAGELLETATFRRAGPIISLFGMGGITFSRKWLVLSKKVCDAVQSPKYQASLVFHELDHVAQQRDWGWIRFMIRYAWEWIKSGFSYERMKKIGIEKEAYDLQAVFNQEIGY